MNQFLQIFDSKRMVFILGGALLGYMLSTNIFGALTGAIIGGILSFIK